MSEAIKDHFAIWRMTYVWLGCFVLGSVCSVILASLQGVTWRTLDGQSKFLIVVAGVLNLTNTIGAFVSKAVSRAQQGRSIIETGDTAHPFPK